MQQRNNWEGADSVYDAWILSDNTPKKWFPYKKFISLFPESELQRLLIYKKQNLEQCCQSTPIEDGKFDFNDTMTSLSENLSSSVIESASENKNQNSSSSDNETLPDSPIKRKCKQRCIQLLCAGACSKGEPPEIRKLVEIMRQMIQKFLKKRKKKNKIFTFRVTLKRRLQCSTL